MRGGRDERDSYRRSEMEFGVAADAYRSDPSRKATRNGAVTFLSPASTSSARVHTST